MHARLAIGEADISELRGLGSQSGRQDHGRAAGDVAMIVAVAVHHGDASSAAVADAIFGDISDPGVEHAGRTGDRQVSETRTFVRRPAPVAGTDDETLARKLATLVK